MFILLFASLTGCSPQDATVSGDWFAWLGANSSETVKEGEVNLSKATVFSCNGLGWDPETCAFEEGYIGSDEGYSDSDRFIGGACEREKDGDLCDGDFVNNCGATEDINEDGVVDAADALAGFAKECEDIDNAEFQTWMQEDSFYGLTDEIEPWRSEAIINSEGDFQLTVHVDLGKDQDFRFHFSIDPDFSPVECVTNEDGEAEIANIDGSDWVDEWSEDEGDYRIFYLNSGSYQVNPNDSETWWYLNSDSLSGWGFSKFAAEELYSHAGRYGNYDEDGNGDGFLGIDDHEVPDLGAYEIAVEDLCAKVYGWDCAHLQTDDDGDGKSEAEGDCNDRSADITAADCPDRTSEDEPLSWQDEMIVMAGAAIDGDAKFENKIEDNTWRPIDETITGLDGWMEVHSSWVRIKNGSKVQEGGMVEGDFQVFYDGAESSSRVLVRGEFKVKDLREDSWGYEVLEDVKRVENGTPFCGESGK